VDVARLQVVWEHADRLWLAGDVMCRLLKYAQSFAIMSSVNMLVVLSVDRHQAIRRPLRPPPAVRTHQSISHEMPPATSLLHVACTSRGSSSYQSISAAGPRPTSAANPPEDAVAVDRRDRQTDGRTLDRLIIITVYYMRAA